MLYIWKMGKESPILRSGIAEKLNCVTITYDGLFLVGGGLSGIIYIWDITSGNLLRFWNGHYKSITSLQFCANDTYLISSSDDSLICIWELSSILNLTQNEIKPFNVFSNHTLPITSISNNRNDNYFISSSLDCTVNLYHIPSKSMLLSILFPIQINTALLTPSFDQIYAGSIDGKIYFININSYSIAKQYYCNTILQYNKLINNNSSESNSDLSYMFYHKVPITKLQLSVENNILISGYENGEIVLWDIGSKQIIRIISTLHTSSINNIMLLNKPKGLNTGYEPLFTPVSFKKYLDNERKIPDACLFSSFKCYCSDKMNYSCSSNVSQTEQTNETITCGISTIDSIRSQSQTMEEEEKEEEKDEEELDAEAKIIKLENSNKALKSMNKELLAYASQLASQLINK